VRWGDARRWFHASSATGVYSITDSPLLRSTTQPPGGQDATGHDTRREDEADGLNGNRARRWLGKMNAVGQSRRPHIAPFLGWALALLAAAGSWPRVAWACLDGSPCSYDCGHGMAAPATRARSCCHPTVPASSQTVSRCASCRVSVTAPDRDLRSASGSERAGDESPGRQADAIAIEPVASIQTVRPAHNEGPPGRPAPLTTFLRAPPKA